MSELLTHLNSEQQEMCTYINGPVLILAGAGSGKTRVLTTRIAHLILDHQIEPWRILAVTFTNKAAKEMKHRVEQMLKRDVNDLWIGTFHSTCARILRREAEHIGYTSNFSIYDTDDSVNVVKKILADVDLNIRQYPPKAFYHFICKQKDKLLNPAPMEYDSKYTTEELQDYIYYRYETELKNNNAFDFNDLIIKCIKLFESSKDVLEKYQRYFKYILVDEYQDTNLSQYKLVRLLSDAHHNLTVVGDEDQSIYKWRGADISNILNFEKDFSQAKTFRLEQNYRSTDIIIDAANRVVKNNTNRLGKHLWTAKENGDKITLIETDSDRHEATEIVTAIEKCKQRYDVGYQDIALLYRTNAQSRLLEDTLRRNGIAYQLIGGFKFYDRKEIKDVLAYLRLVVNPSDSLSLRRIINIPARGIGNTTIAKIESYALAHHLTFFDALGHISEIPKLNKATLQKLHQFKELILKYIQQSKQLNAFELTCAIVEETGLVAQYQLDPTIENQSRIDNINELINSISEFVEERGEEATLEQFLQEVQLLSDVDQMNETQEKVTLMTLHSAKGLEFPVVFISGMEEGLFPHENALMSPDDIEEERRLFYVGITRAEQKLYLSWAKQRTRNYGNSTGSYKSSFLREIPKELLTVHNVQQKFEHYIPKKEKKVEANYDEFDQSTQLQMGMAVEHDIFGQGVISMISGMGENAKITVNFKNVGTKKLISKFAKLKPAEFFD